MTKSELARALGTFSLRTQALFLLSLVLGGIFVLGLYWKLNRFLGTPVAVRGGSLTEGIIGTPRFINPLLATSDSDRDLAALIYSGLLRYDATGNLVPDLAASYTISPDGRVYTFTLKPNLTWHDGEAVTANDVVFTVNRVQDPALKSPRRAAWEGVTVVAKNDKTVEFTLRQPYAPFLGNLIFGLLPEHLWKNIDTESLALSNLNTEGIGTGPYRITEVERDRGGIPTIYKLKAFKNFALGEPRITRLTIRVYPNEEAVLTAFARGEIESMGAISPAATEPLKNEPLRIVTAPLPRVFGVFFNQSLSPVLADKAVRRALEAAAPRDEIVNQVLKSFAAPITGPLPPSLTSDGASAQPTFTEKDPATILEAGGWTKNAAGFYEKKIGDKVRPFAFTITTSDAAELRATGEILKDAWSKIGAVVTLEVFEASDLNQNIIRPRKYEALLFGQVIGYSRDLFPFWHSSQRLDPGLNVALYASAAVDKLLEEARTTQVATRRAELATKTATEISSDQPAIFLYAPRFIYVLPKKIKGLDLPLVTTAADRFATVHQWFINTDYVWKIFN